MLRFPSIEKLGDVIEFAEGECVTHPTWLLGFLSEIIVGYSPSEGSILKSSVSADSGDARMVSIRWEKTKSNCSASAKILGVIISRFRGTGPRSK
jgi:hypothetical protein